MVIAPKETILNMLSRSDVIKSETQEGTNTRLTLFLRRLNREKLRSISRVSGASGRRSALKTEEGSVVNGSVAAFWR